MSHPQQFRFLVCTFLLVEPLLALDAAGQPSRGVLVLRNGEVLAGTTSKVGDRYVVAQSDGTELRIPTREVEMHCLDLDEAYLRKRQSVSQRDASAVLQLAEWCLRYGLYARAADELLLAIAIAPRDPRIQGLERRLQAATNSGSNRETPLAATPALPRQPPPERLQSTLPADAIENFASRVQPLLLNRCATNACHGGRSSTEFQLVSPGLGKTTTLRHTQRNLAAVIQQLNTAKPEESPLLVIPQTPHGGLSASVFGERDQAQLKLLENWIVKASQAVPPESIFANRSSSQLPQGGISQGVTLPGVTVESATALPNAQCVQAKEGLETEAAAMVDFQDPFDPERFNRRFLPPAEDPKAVLPASVSGGSGDSTVAEAIHQAP